MLVIQMLWKESGWGTIVFLAALSAVEIQLYEAAYIDGATNFQRLIYITLPSIRSTIIIMLILRLGKFMDTGFDQIYNMLNGMNREAGEVFDTYIYEQALSAGSTAIRRR
jgi:putative aldouronate transport system permease protein